MAAKQVNFARPLSGMKDIMETYGWSQEQFYMFLRLGLPARKINSRWYAHPANIDAFLRSLLSSSKPLTVDSGQPPRELQEA